MTHRTRVEAVIELVTAYFEGLHTGDIEQRAGVFDPQASLQADGLRLTREPD
jgi:hypothetical protein